LPRRIGCFLTSSYSYVFTTCAATGGDLATLRGFAVADACARAGGDAVALVSADGLPGPADPGVERWAQWLIGKLDAAGSVYQRGGEGWRLRTGKLHEESERRVGELDGWSEAALAGQRKLLEHVDDPGDDGTDLEQSLSKLAAAGWSVDSKKDKKAPAVHYAAGDLPLATGDDWRATGAVHPRLAAALGFFLAALPEEARAAEPDSQAAALADALPALAVAGPDDAAALLDIRTVAKALRDAGALDLPGGEPLGAVIAVGKVRLRAAPSAKATAATNGAAPAPGAATATAMPSGDTPETDAGSTAPTDGARDADDSAAQDATATANDPSALAARHGAEAVRFALLHAAAPEKRFRGGDDVVGYAARFLAELDELAAARLDGAAPGGDIDLDDGLRRRLAGWCATAAARTAENYDRRDLHRATRNTITLLARIRDFDAAVSERRGEVSGADRQAIAAALGVLGRLLAPLAPSSAAALARSAPQDRPALAVADNDQ
jgi:hypothetical protein